MSRVYINYNLVEGEWKDFIFKRITPAEYPMVLEHCKEFFYKEEPTCKLLGYSELFYSQMDIVVTALLEHNLSFYAVEKTTGELAGVRITFRESKDLLKVFEELLDYDNLDPRTDVMLNGTDMPEEKRDELYNKWGIDEYAEFFAVSTLPKFQNRGLSMELYKRSLEFLKAEGFKIATCIFTSAITRRAAEKLGFVEFHRTDYKDIRDVNGNLMFDPEKLNDEHFCVAMFKQL